MKRLREDSISNASSHTDHPDQMRSHALTKCLALDSIPDALAGSIVCHLPPHQPIDFSSLEDYETHYRDTHTNRCTACGRNFPSAHLLGLHVTENHDPISAIRRERGESVFRCFVEGCDKVCIAWTNRRRHLVDKHGYPRNYDFFIVNDGIDGRTNMLRPDIDSSGRRLKSDPDNREKSPKVTAHYGQTQTPKTKSSHGSSEMASEKDPSLSDVAQVPPGEDLIEAFSSLSMVPRVLTLKSRERSAGGKNVTK